MRSILIPLFTTLLTNACVDDTTLPPDVESESDGKEDGFGIPLVERKLAEATRQPEHVMQDATYLYYFLFTPQDEAANPQTRSLMRVRKIGGGAEQVATIPMPWVHDAALGGNTIYMVDHESLYRVSTAGGATTLVANVGAPIALAADGQGVYVASQTFENDRYFQRISRIAAGSSTPVELGRATYVTSMATDDTHLYWLDETQPNPAIGCGSHAGALHKVGKLGGADLTLAAGINCPIQLAVDATHVYFTNWGMSDLGLPVSRVGKLGGLPLVLGFSGGAEIATDATHVFWISPAAALQRRSKLTGMQRTLASDVAGGLRADATATYFWRTTYGGEAPTYTLYRLGY